MTVDWAAVDALPVYVRAAMRALHLERPELDGLGDLTAADWERLLGWLDRQQMTLLFGQACAGRLPAAVADAMERRLDANRIRLAGLRREYGAIAEALGEAGIPHVMLKGFTHGPPYVPAAELRPQYDLDLLVDPDQLREARRALEGLGFAAVEERGNPPADHSPPLVRRTGWRWKGDYFDPEIPTVVELHFRLWDAATEGFDLPGLADAWSRAGGDPPALAPADRAVYASAHALRHLLRGSLKALHLYELARVDETWKVDGLTERVDWRLATVRALAHQWFGGPPSERLPSSVEAWLESYAASPLTREFRPNKDELWLHLELVQGWRLKTAAIRRRLFPLTLPGRLEGQYDDSPPGLGVRLDRGLRYTGFLARRAGFHARGAVALAAGAARWAALKKNAGSRPASPEKSLKKERFS